MVSQNVNRENFHFYLVSEQIINKSNKGKIAECAAIHRYKTRTSIQAHRMKLTIVKNVQLQN